VSAAPSPLAIYTQQRDARRAQTRRLDAIERRISTSRGVVFGVGLVTWYLVVGPKWLSPWWILAAVVLFLAFVVAHEVTTRRRRRADRAVAFYERGLAHIEDRWDASGEDDGSRFLSAEHPYTEDLDVFGPGSLYQRLDTAQTSGGKRTLATWLQGPAESQQIELRQRAVAELRDRLSFREDLWLLGGDNPQGLRCEALALWGTSPPVSFPTWLRAAALLLPLLPFSTAAGWLGYGWGLMPFAFSAGLVLVFAQLWKARVHTVIGAAERPGPEIRALALILARIEAETFSATLLARLQSTLQRDPPGADRPPSGQLVRLARLIDLAESVRNPLFAPFAALMLWDLHQALSIEAWRRATKGCVPEWIAALGETEALCSLAAYSFENPDDPFPTIIAGPAFQAEQLGHPLLPRTSVVRNDLRLDADRSLFIVSGSNMSGKSTLLRAVGVNAVLAFAGAPVRALRLELSRLTVGASIRVHDSLREGSSRFYAEITRLREILRLADAAPPLLFLLDEILHGTNSADRRVGAEAVMRGLLERGALGLVTTHDLALAQIPTSLPGRAANVHFEDQLADGLMTFDYRMRPGTVEKSNALELMRAVGLLES
jgi:hypothetical protein